MKWINIKDRKPKRHDGFSSPYINCVVYACNPDVLMSGVIQTCRWDVEKACWVELDIRTNWLLQEPYKITHFIDDLVGPYGRLERKTEIERNKN